MPKTKKKLEDDDSDNDASSVDSADSDKQVNVDNSPKIIPVAKLPEKLKTKKIVINVSDTQYPIVAEVAQELGWNIEENEGLGDWDIWWTDRQIEPNTLYRMNLHQKINHFPGIYVLARKNLLGLHLMAMQKKYPQEYNFFPETWIVPMQFPQFRQYYQNIEEGKVRTYIVKPQAQSQGRGIFLTRSIQDILNGRKYVIQRYLKNPLLLDGLKFDLRIYVLLAGSQPLRLYIYDEGLVRLATKPYQAPTSENLHESYIHLTNYSLNKNNPAYVYNKSQKQMNVGHKRSLKSVFEKLQKEGIDVNRIKQQIEEIVIKTVISGLPSIRHQYKYCQPQEYEGNMCFHILGFDVMIMDDLKPILLEINHTPSFETSTPLDYQIKKNLITDTFRLMRVNSKHKKQLFNKSKELTKIRVETGKRNILKGQERNDRLEEVQKARDEEENLILNSCEKPNGFKKIFPFENAEKNALYDKIYEAAEVVMKEEKENRKNVMSQDRGETNQSSVKKEPSSKKVIRERKLSVKEHRTKVQGQIFARKFSTKKQSIVESEIVIENNLSCTQTLGRAKIKEEVEVQMGSSVSVKKTESVSTVSKASFQIRNNNSCHQHQQQSSYNSSNLKISGGFRRSSINIDDNKKLTLKAPEYPTQNKNYNDLMDKFARSKELENGLTAEDVYQREFDKSCADKRLIEEAGSLVSEYINDIKDLKSQLELKERPKAVLVKHSAYNNRIYCKTKGLPVSATKARKVIDAKEVLADYLAEPNHQRMMQIEMKNQGTFVKPKTYNLTEENPSGVFPFDYPRTSPELNYFSNLSHKQTVISSNHSAVAGGTRNNKVTVKVNQQGYSGKNRNQRTSIKQISLSSNPKAKDFRSPNNFNGLANYPMHHQKQKSASKHSKKQRISDKDSQFVPIYELCSNKQRKY